MHFLYDRLVFRNISDSILQFYANIYGYYSTWSIFFDGKKAEPTMVNTYIHVDPKFMSGQ